jgi:hypothetical protein
VSTPNLRRLLCGSFLGFFTATFFVACLVLPFCAIAQTELAGVYGRVTDQSGAVIVDAEVEIKNVETNISTTVRTNQDGLYTIPSLHPGHYLISARKPGFKTVTVTQLELNVQDNVVRNFALQVGSIAETVTITADQNNINTADASVSTVVDQSYIKNMPLNGRSLQDLILLTPGIVTQSPQNNANTANGVTGEFSVNGQRPEENYYTVDGVSANLGTIAGGSAFGGAGPSGSLPAATALGTTQALVSVDDLQEFRVQSSTYSAEYGRTPGAQFAFETKSGVNQWHGSAFDYLRNDAMDATDFFTNALRGANPALTKPPLRQNDFGGTLGGPVEVPRLYSGKDKTFFFFSYEGLRLIQPQPAGSFPVPDAALRTSTPAPLNQVLNAFPVQTPGAPDDLPNGVGQFVGTWSNPSSIDSTSVRFDQTIGSKARVFFRFSNTASDTTTRGGPPDSGVPITFKTVSSYSTRTYTAGASGFFTSRLSNDFRLNYSSNYTTGVTANDKFGGGVPVDMAQLSGLGSRSEELVGFLLGPNLLALQQSFDAGSQRQWNIVDTVSYSLGRHQLKFGWDYRRLAPFAVLTTPEVQYIYSSTGSVQSNTSDFTGEFAQAPAYPLYKNSSLFAQDEWKLTQRLNLSLGLRWEVNPPPGVTQGLMPYTIQGSNPSTWTVAPQGTPLWHTTWYNFAPRLGAAYIIWNNAGWETVLRAGGGVFFDTGQQLGSIGFGGPGFSSVALGSGNSFPKVLTPCPTPTPGCDAQGIPLIADPTTETGCPPAQQPCYGFLIPPFFPADFQLPYALQWNGSVEQALGKSQTLTFSYVGSHGARLIREDRISTPTNPNASSFEAFRNGLTSDYHSAQVQFQRRLSRGLTSLASYTWAHCIDYGSQNYLFGYHRGNCDVDVRHNFTGAFSYDLPNVGHNGFLNALLHHWGLDDRFTARSSFPVTLNGVTYIDPNTGKVVNGGLNWDPTQPLYLYGATCNQIFQNALPPGCPGGRAINPNAFSPAVDPVTGNPTLGNAPRNLARGFGAWQMNLGVRREFPLYERMKLQFRAEAFNVFNHPNFGTISSGSFSGYCSPNPTNPNFTPACNFGLANATLANSLGNTLTSLYQTGGPRSMQVSLKVVF